MMQSNSHEYVDAMKADIKEERLVQNIMTEGEGQTFRGCWIGCAMREYDRKLMAEKIGWPLALVHIGEAIFEGMEKPDAQAFAVDILAAPKAKADLSLVHWKFLHWLIKGTLSKHGTPEVHKGCAKSLSVLLDMAKGVNVAEARAHAAAHAAAYAAYAAEDAADAAHAAADAAHAAAYAARAAEDAAAYAARAAEDAAAYAARAAEDAADAAYAAAYASARYKEMGEKLLQFMREA